MQVADSRGSRQTGKIANTVTNELKEQLKMDFQIFFDLREKGT